MAKLILKSCVSGSFMIFSLFGTFACILVGMVFLHGSTSRDELGIVGLLFVDTPRKPKSILCPFGIE